VLDLSIECPDSLFKSATHKYNICRLKTPGILEWSASDISNYLNAELNTAYTLKVKAAIPNYA